MQFTPHYPRSDNKLLEVQIVVIHLSRVCLALCSLSIRHHILSFCTYFLI